MLSKFLRSSYLFLPSKSLLSRSSISKVVVRDLTFIPASQYDSKYPKKFSLGYAIKTYWEITPLLFCTAIALGFSFCAIIWAINHKVDVVFQTNSRANISRTMDLRNPTVHKMITINQKYEPWPEMQDVIDKMTTAEKRAMVRATACSLP